MPRTGSRYLPPHARMRTLRRPRRPTAETPPPAEATPKRAREESGRYQGDDPATPEVNEAYVGGKPTAPAFDRKMTKSRLLQIAKKLGLKDLSMENRKSEILSALEKATK